jgi:hypothetical protein
MSLAHDLLSPPGKDYSLPEKKTTHHELDFEVLIRTESRVASAGV